MVRLYLLLIALLLCACTNSSNAVKQVEEMGYWEDDKPYRGTLDKNKFHVTPYWQCVEPFTPYKNKEC